MNHPTSQLLEPRRLLAVNFAASDLAGTFGLFAESASGILTLNAAGTVTGGSFTDGDGVTSQITGGTFTITPAGLVHATVETSDPEIDGVGLVGAMTSNTLC